MTRKVKIKGERILNRFHLSSTTDKWVYVCPMFTYVDLKHNDKVWQVTSFNEGITIFNRTYQYLVYVVNVYVVATPEKLEEMGKCVQTMGLDINPEKNLTYEVFNKRKLGINRYNCKRVRHLRSLCPETNHCCCSEFLLLSLTKSVQR